MCHYYHSAREKKIKLKNYLLLFYSFSFFLFSGLSGAEKISINQGLTIIYEKNTLSSSTTTHIFIKAGTASEPEQKKGLTYLTTSLSMGMIDSNKRKLMTQLGSHLSFQVKGDFSLITITCLSSNLEPTLKILFEVLSKPLFSSFRINRIKSYMKHQQVVEKDDAIHLMDLTQRLIFFSKKSYGSSIYGNSESLDNIKRKDILKYYQDYFNCSNMIVSISSSLKISVIKDIFNRLFPKFPLSRISESPKPSPVIPKKKNYFFQKGLKQTLIAIVISTPELGPKKFAEAFVLENLLGKGIGSKLWYLREQKKLAYHVNAKLWQFKNGGILSTYLKTENPKKDLAYLALVKILNQLYDNGISSDEFQINKNHAKADFLRLVENRGRKVFLRTYFEVMELGSFYIDHLLSEIEKLTFDEFNSYIKKILSAGNRIRIIIGPEDLSSST